jgi:hypothetical protein
MKNTTLIINVLFAAVIIYLMFEMFYRKPDEQPLNFKEKYDSLYQQQSNQRLVYIRLIDSLTSSNQLLRTELDNTNKELESIPGRYDNHTPSELEIEMEKRASNGR